MFQLAWDRTIPNAIFVEYAFIITDDPKVKAINTGIYDRVLSKAQAAGMDTFGFISKLFIAQIIPQDVAISDTEYSNLYIKYGTEFTSRYISFEALIKQYKFV